MQIKFTGLNLFVQGPVVYREVGVIEDLDAVDLSIGTDDFVGEEQADDRQVFVAEFNDFGVQFGTFGGPRRLWI